MPIKLALVTPKSHVLPHCYPVVNQLTNLKSAVSLNDLETHLEDRATCETDESLLQIIPYITLKNGNEYYAYSRGVKSNEDRLVAKMSVGLGGHIESTAKSDQSLEDLIAEEAIRELEEEVGVVYSFHYIKEILTNKKFNLFYDDRDSVGRVHLGLHFVLEIDKDDIVHEEHGVITDTGWYTKEQLSKNDRLEGWSQIVLSVL